MDLNLKTKKRSIDPNMIKFVLIPAVLLLISIALLYKVAYPSYTAIPAKQAEVKTLETKDQLLKNKISKLNDLEDFREVVLENTNIVNSALPTKAEVPLLLTQVQKISTDSGLLVTNLTYSPSSTKIQNTGQVVVQLSARGTFSEVRAFLYAIEEAARVVDVTTFRVGASKGATVGGEEASTNDIEITLGLSSNYQEIDPTAITEEPINVDIRDKKFLAMIDKLKKLKVYKTTVDNNNIGKDNPFNQ